MWSYFIPVLVALGYWYIVYNSSTHFVIDEKDIVVMISRGVTSTSTPLILEALDRHNVNATFFVLGDNIDTGHLAEPQHILKNKILLNVMIKNYRDMGTHAYDYDFYDLGARSYFGSNFEKSLSKTRCNLRQPGTLMYRKPFLYSIPYRMYNELTRQNYTIVNPDIQCFTLDVDRALKCIFRDTKEGSIIELLDGTPENAKVTVEILDKIVPYYKSKGYTFRTLSYMIKNY